MLNDVVIGAVTKGVNRATFAAVNLVLCSLWAVIAYMLYVGVTQPKHSWLAPHAGLMLAICTLLWAVIAWFITQTGLTASGDQHAELEAAMNASEPGEDDMDGQLREKLRALPIQSKLDVFGSTDFGFDSSNLQIQNLQGTALVDTKDKSQ